MFWYLRTFVKFFRAINGDAKPWQILLGTMFGVLMGFLPFFSFDFGLYWSGALVVLLALIINCHIGSVLLFWGLGTLIWLATKPLSLAIGNGLDGFAQMASGNTLLYQMGLSHTGWLGSTVLGLIIAPVLAGFMWWFTHYFRAKWQPKLKERKRLAKAGKVGGNLILLRITCWFFGI